MYREQLKLIPPHLEEDGESSAGFVEDPVFVKIYEHLKKEN